MGLDNYDRFFGLFEHINHVAFVIEGDWTENKDNCTVELRDNVQKILDDTEDFRNIPLDSIMDEIKEKLTSLTKENKECYIIGLLQKWANTASYFDIQNERDEYWIEGHLVPSNNDLLVTVKEVISKYEKKPMMLLKAKNIEKYLTYCYWFYKDFFSKMDDYCRLIDIDFYSLYNKVITPPQTKNNTDNSNEKQPDHSKLLVALNNYITGIIPAEFTNIIEYHTFSPGTAKALWIGKKKVDAWRFCKQLNMTIEAWNSAFRFPDNKKLHGKYKDKLDKDSPIIAILKTHLDK